MIQFEKMKLRLINNLVCAAMLSVLVCTTAASSTQAATSCPRIRIECVSNNACCGPRFQFVAHVGDDAMTGRLTYKWSVSASRIESGQGTRAIKVDMSKDAGKALTVTVEIGGLPVGCERVVSYSQSFCEPEP